MRPIQKTWTKVKLNAPEGWAGKCEPLWVCQLGLTYFSYWKPSWKDRLLIFFGRHIRLIIVSERHPPVIVDTEKL